MNAADYLLECVTPEKTALITETSSHTYREVIRAADGTVRALRDLGVQPGERVGLSAENSLFWVASYLGILRAGAVAVPFYPTLEAEQFAALVELTEPRAFCVQERYLRQFADRYPPEVSLVLPSAEAARRHGRRGRVVAPEPADPVPSTPVDECKDLAALMFTSGSTGTPRAVMVSHRNITANTDAIIASLALGGDDRIMVVLPFHYCFGTSLLHTHLRANASLVLNNRFAFPQVVLDHMEATACTELAGVPSTYQILLRNSTFPERRFPRLRKLQQAGGKLPDRFIAELRAAHPDADYYLMYGQTEATARLSCLPPRDLEARPGSIGRGIPGVTLQVLDEDGCPVPPGVTGEIVARGDNVTLGYWRDPEATRQTHRGGALWTGDLAKLDEDGYIHVVDRAKDFLKPFGHRVSSKQIEDHVVEIADVVEAAVVGVPDDLMGEAARAFVVLRRQASVSAEDILAHCRHRLPPYAVPREVVVLPALPRSAGGKVDKASLKRAQPIAALHPA
ncbi:MAG: AMP-binding protein [Candidatus Latescibacterota bacterium]